MYFYENYESGDALSQLKQKTGDESGSIHSILRRMR